MVAMDNVANCVHHMSNCVLLYGLMFTLFMCAVVWRLLRLFLRPGFQSDPDVSLTITSNAFFPLSFFPPRDLDVNGNGDGDDWLQFVRVCMDNQPANVRLFVMHGGVETFVELVGSAFQHAHSLTASSSTVTPLPIAASAPGGDGTGASPTGSSGSEEHFGSAKGGRVPRRERASDLSVALTCRELVVECISCLSSALEVSEPQGTVPR